MLRSYDERYGSLATTTPVMRMLFPLSRRRVIVKTLTLSGNVRHDCLPKGYIRQDAYLLGVSRWKGVTLHPLAFGLAIATANAH